MTKTITRCNKIVNRLFFNHFCNNLIQFIPMRISKKYRFDIGIVHSYMLHTIFFLVATCKFVLFNPFVHIILHRGTNHQTVLSFSVHGLSIHIVLLGIVLHQPTFVSEFIKIFKSLIIHLFIMLISSRFKINFGLNNMIQRHWISLRFGTGFFRIQYIVRT